MESYGVGDVHVGDAPVGGSDGEPVFVNLYPEEGAKGAQDFASFEAVSYKGNLDTASITITVNGVLAYSGGYREGFTGFVEDTPKGRRFTFRPTQHFEGQVEVELWASTTDGKSASKTWTWESPEGFSVSKVEVRSSLMIRVHFNAVLAVNPALTEPSNYAITVRAGYAQPAYVGAVSVPTDKPRYVDLHLRDHLSLGGNYDLRVRGVRDVSGREVTP